MNKKCSLCGEVLPDFCITMCKLYTKSTGRPSPTVFDRITASPEVLAEKLLYCTENTEIVGGLMYRYKCYVSTIIPGVYFEKESEAIAATVAKLKEVEE